MTETTTYEFEGVQYAIRDGLIVSPGKFEGEPIFVLHFWSFAMKGGADGQDDEGSFFFKLEDIEREENPDLDDAVRLMLWEDDQGFVHHKLIGDRK